MQYLTAYVESDEYESVEGVLSMRMVADSDEKVEQAIGCRNVIGGASRGLCFDGKVAWGDNCGCCIIRRSFWHHHRQTEKRSSATVLAPNMET